MPKLANGILSVAAVTALFGCAQRIHRTSTQFAPSGCDPIVAATDRDVGARIYAQASAGRVVTGSVARVERSAALAAAVGHDDPAAADAVLRRLMQSRIERIAVLRGSRVLAAVGDRAAIAPATGTIRDAKGRPVGRFVLSDTAASGMANIVASLTGARVSITFGNTVLATAGRMPARIASTRDVGGSAFPTGPARVRLLVPASGRSSCTTADALGMVGERLYRGEQASGQTRRVLRVVARDRGFEHAVARDDPPSCVPASCTSSASRPSMWSGFAQSPRADDWSTTSAARSCSRLLPRRSACMVVASARSRCRSRTTPATSS
jgi:hypothetical protein